MRAVGRPGFHVLAKAPGQTISCFWTAKNNGNAVGNAALVLFNETMAGLTVKGGAVAPILPGATRSLDLLAFLTQGVNVVPGPNQMTLEMQFIEENKAFFAHPFTVNFNVPTSLQVMLHTLTVVSPDVWEWRVRVRNSGSVAAFYQPVRTETTSLNPTQFVRRMTTRTVLPVSENMFLSVTNTAATRVFGEAWVEEVTLAGVFIRELPGRISYDLFP